MVRQGISAARHNFHSLFWSVIVWEDPKSQFKTTVRDTINNTLVENQNQNHPYCALWLNYRL